MIRAWYRLRFSVSSWPNLVLAALLAVVGGQREGVAQQESAKEKALAVHAKATAIDQLPSFSIYGTTGTRSSQPLENPAQDPLTNLKRALDEPTEPSDWFRYRTTFAWDDEGFVTMTHMPREGIDKSVDHESEDAYLPSTTRWGTKGAAGSTHHDDDGVRQHVIQANMGAAWGNVQLSNPNFLLASRHSFWWGSNLSHNQSFSPVSPANSSYRQLESEIFDGEMCDVVESRMRKERLWISQESGHLRGYLQLSYEDLRPGFYKTDAVTETAGEKFETLQAYLDWLRKNEKSLSTEQLDQLNEAGAKYHEASPMRAYKLVRFRDYREISPGIFWPFEEDRVQSFQDDKGFHCILMTFRVHEIRLDRDLESMFARIQPTEGEVVQDHRFETPVNYNFRANMKEEEIRELVASQLAELEEGKAIYQEMQKPYEEMVGKPAPSLPKEGWIGEELPDLTSGPYLVHFWLVGCGPCMNEYPILSKLHDQGLKVVGYHPAGTPRKEIEAYREKFKQSYPAFLPSEEQEENGNAGFPTRMFPYSLVVDAKGNVVAHGNLFSTIAKLRELSENDKNTD
ncbi:TlpA family protein disulfide reductase [Blastopirellula marina]|uniref:Thioredoxin domain-containing protein n=1 Tax=Blastopirellula marina TaxID=124 RepID=A0A2S8GRV9_9BACT|nr:TlpA disulfide reductase family protein [Blastopirellula marina]PQO47111.1 hypothetical protein C5Y93_06370 [Blastopirellula marina]